MLHGENCIKLQSPLSELITSYSWVKYSWLALLLVAYCWLALVLVAASSGASGVFLLLKCKKIGFDCEKVCLFVRDRTFCNDQEQLSNYIIGTITYRSRS